MSAAGLDSTLWTAIAVVAVLSTAGCLVAGLALFFRVRADSRNRSADMTRENTLRSVADSLNRLEGSIQHVNSSQHQNFAEIGRTMTDVAKDTKESLGELRTRLQTMDKAQDTITGLSNDILSLQDILSNKQTRGMFGEVQLHSIVSMALPPGSFDMQKTLSNGKRADCVIRMPDPPGDIVIDSKFPLEAWEALRNAETDEQQRAASRDLRSSVRRHITDIADKYIISGETSDGAIMFLPSEAVYAELHANHPDVVRDGFRKRVWIVSPTTCMATLNTLRAVLKDVRLRKHASQLRSITGSLVENIDRLSVRVENLERHFSQAAQDIDQIRISAGKLKRQASVIDSLDLDEAEAQPAKSSLNLPE